MALLLFTASIAAALASSAQANLGYEPDPSHPSFDLNGVPRGLTVDQTSQDLYVAIMSKDFTASPFKPGEIQRFNSDLSADGTFAQGGGYYLGVGVNPITHGFYGMQGKLRTPPLGELVGASKLDRFSPAGSLDGSSALTPVEAFPPIATDSAGNVFYPNSTTHSVQVFDSAGVLQKEITCAACTGGPLGSPISVALNSKDDLYVVDTDPDRVVKLTLSGGSYSFASVLQSGLGAGAVGVDPGTDDVLVGDLPNGKNYHVIAYHSSGAQFDDFGAGLFTNPPPQFGVTIASQMAIDGTSHRLYMDEFEKILVFDKVTIDPPAATIKPGTGVGQLVATLEASVNANGHAALECEFEYIDDPDFQANGFANPLTAPCSKLPNGSSDTAINAKVSGLSPATTYHFRVTATSNAGSDISGSEAFETLPAVPPDVTTESALTVTHATAALKGKVNPRGGSVSDCYFELGTSVSYGTKLFCLTPPGPVSVEVAESQEASGLMPNTSYHYRLVVTTNAGTTEGNDVEFKTASPPPEPPAPALPAPLSEPAPAPSPSSGPTAPPPPLRCKKGFRKKMVRGKVRCVRKRHPRRHRRHRR